MQTIFLLGDLFFSWSYLSLFGSLTFEDALFPLLHLLSAVKLSNVKFSAVFYLIKFKSITKNVHLGTRQK